MKLFDQILSIIGDRFSELSVLVIADVGSGP